ncbi:glutathione S-transferase C-terminal domain-containing protein [Brenneria tiliae]|uniref:Glutathione S-transferase C-terminal domain-containing protein n=1 Tax=Brenneria tiliae TaxID=2914984 RepID=A0ABT0MPJ8_9GAMM|nr:glutathione S-transferase C-terminal domain-containing protein [Brenneria tiliae]MCL2891761.1 glutathione S-transferase C-terminal domain-containing protein [Brenneria tiliae]
MTTIFPEKTVEQSHDGAFVRQSNVFTQRFGRRPGQLPVEAGRYRLIVSTGCGWSRRQLIVRRLLGLEQAISVGYVTTRGDDGWEFDGQPGGVDAVFKVARLNELYRRARPGYDRRGTVPALVEAATGRVAANDYHTLSIDLATAWAPLHRQGAPDLYPQALRPQIDLLNQQIFDDVNNGPYKVLFATSSGAAAAAKTVFEARLADLDFRLQSRRYLFGEQLTDADVRLFVTLASFDTNYRPNFPAELGPVKRITDFPHLWAYARDLFQTPGFIDEREQVSLGLLPQENGKYRRGFSEEITPDEDPLALWLAPHGRELLRGAALSSGPGAAGTAGLWRWGEPVVA